VDKKQNPIAMNVNQAPVYFYVFELFYATMVCLSATYLDLCMRCKSITFMRFFSGGGWGEGQQTYLESGCHQAVSLHFWCKL